MNLKCRGAACRSSMVRIRGTKLTPFLVAVVLVNALAFAASPQEEKYLKEVLLPQVYGASAEVSRDILQRFPPDKFHYVTVGRSPTMVEAILSELAPEAVTSLPISGLTKHVSAGSPAAVERAIIEHFRKVLPLDSALQGKKLLFIDYTYTGISLQKAIDLAEKARPNTAIEGYLLGVPRAPPPFRSVVHLNESLANTKLNDVLRYEAFDKWARYREAPADKMNPGYAPQENPDYEIFRKEIQEQLKNDISLSVRLEKKGCALHYSALSR